MKKIISLLLAMVLLVPALALAEPAELPTFDFTAEEWLARYQEVVGEDSEWYFDDFEIKRPQSRAANDPLRTEYIHMWDDGRASMLIDGMYDFEFPSMVVLRLLKGPFINGSLAMELLPDIAAELCSVSEKVVRATLPSLTDEEIEGIFEQLAMTVPTEDVIYAPVTAEINGIFFAFSATDTTWFSISADGRDATYVPN